MLDHSSPTNADRDAYVSRGAILAGSALGFLAVGLGAFGAHGLKGSLEGLPDAAQRVSWWETAAHYHLVHALALMALGPVAAALRARLAAAAWCFGLGIAVFAGTLYAMALGAPRWFGAITPIGGALLMTGWLAVALAALRARRAGPDQ